MKKIKYVKKLAIFLLILCALTIFLLCLKSIYHEKIKEGLLSNIKIILDQSIQDEKKEYVEGEAIGMLVIPKIGMEAPITQGTSLDILKNSIGHFQNTSVWQGNIALASHNRGSYAHYFSRINELENR